MIRKNRSTEEHRKRYACLIRRVIHWANSSSCRYKSIRGKATYQHEKNDGEVVRSSFRIAFSSLSLFLSYFTQRILSFLCVCPLIFPSPLSLLLFLLYIVCRALPFPRSLSHPPLPTPLTTRSVQTRRSLCIWMNERRDGGNTRMCVPRSRRWRTYVYASYTPGVSNYRFSTG